MFWLEIGPLGGNEYTGIATVVCHLARQMLADRTMENRYFIERREVPKDVVAEIVELRSGAALAWLAANCALPPVSVISDYQSVGVFGNVKTAHFVFDYEAQLIHDLSCLLTPEFHRPQVNQYHYERLVRDLATNDLNVCVSHSTKADVERYFPEATRNGTLVAHLGCEWPAAFVETYAQRFTRAVVPPYILVLGTIEPRKNIDAILSYVARNRGLCDKFIIVFCGGHGWGPAVKEKIVQFRLGREVERGRLVFTGFVGEFAKYCLLANCTVAVYPSLFEGFGLPVVEALSLGRPVIATESSSIPEVGADAVYYFDPFEPDSFAAALWRALDALAADPAGVGEKARIQGRLFSWQRFYALIKERILCDLSERADRMQVTPAVDHSHGAK